MEDGPSCLGRLPTKLTEVISGWNNGMRGQYMVHSCFFLHFRPEEITEILNDSRGFISLVVFARAF
jgi:hypothetical protein